MLADSFGLAAEWRPPVLGSSALAWTATGKVQLTLCLSGSKEELTALYGELRS